MLVAAGLGVGVAGPGAVVAAGGARGAAADGADAVAPGVKEANALMASCTRTVPASTCRYWCVKCSRL